VTDAPFYCQNLADIGDNPYMPEFLCPDERGRWRWINVDGGWFTYVIYSERCRRPLYVGFTGDIRQRLSQHSSKPWWCLVDRIIVDLHDTEQEARQHEAHVIRQRPPLFNLAHPRVIE
jgi:predicted GIY-YIG superfamily endonuclease